MLKEILRRARRLHRLLWVDERVSVLEERNRNQTEALRKKDEMLRVQFDTLEKQNEALQKQIESLKKQANESQKRDRLLQRQLDRSEDELEALKSSFEVPEELIGEFQSWKTRNPIPGSPLITVVVSTHNRADALAERCIPSILNQTYEKLELVVVGDNCTDGTEEVVRSIKDPRLRFINLSERQAYPEDPLHRWMVAGTPALNEGLSMSEGDYITHLDDDDEYTLERLETLVEFAKDNDCDFVWHPFWVGKEGDWILNEARRLSYGQVTTSSVLYRSWFKKIPWDIEAYRLNEPGDWNRFRKIKYLNPATMRYPEPLLKHYRDEVAGLP
jgi:chaperonin cofactor prefoldin